MAPEKLSGRGAVPSSFGKTEAFLTNPHPNHQRGIGGMDPSVYLSVSRRDSDFADEFRCPVFKVKVPYSSLPGVSATWVSPHRIATVDIGVGGKTFISLPSGWIIGVGGDPGSTIIIDTTKTPTKVIRGPDLVALKWNPVLAVVGNKVYALCNSPSYKREPNFVPWFEVLDLSKAKETADGSLNLDGCAWEQLPWPACFPRRLTPKGYLCPPIINIRSYVVVGPYILISLNQQTSCTYAFDTNSGEWHKINKSLPFIGRATPLGHKGCIYLCKSLEEGPINAYRIHISSSISSSSTIVAGLSSGKGTSLNLSITACPIINKTHHLEVGTTMAGQHIFSLDREHFSLLTFSPGDRKHRMTYFNGDGESYPTKLFAKLTTYHIENPALLEVTHDQEKVHAVKHEIVVSKRLEQNFNLFSSYGFSCPAIPFVLSI